MNQESIGKAAGTVWKYLRENGGEGVSLAALKKIRGVKPDEAVAAVGWLAREQKLAFQTVKNRVLVSLAEHEHELA